MKSGRLFLGTVFLGAGVFLLFSRFELLPEHLLLSWRWWPLVLVFTGFAILIRKVTAKISFIVLAALTFASITAGLIHLPWTYEGRDHDGSYDQFFSEPYVDSIRSAVMRVETSAGELTVRSTHGDLVNAAIESGVSAYAFRTDRREGRVEADLIQEESGWRPGGKIRNIIDLRLRQGPSWRLHIDAGAADVRADLSDLRMESVTIDAAAASVHMTLGSDAPRCRVQIDAGASSVTLRIPMEAGCKMEIDAGWSDIQIPGFTRLGSGRYRTANSDTASCMILVDFDAGASSIRVERY
ncbi:MAG: DUF5668 domain-containing protein [Ignavibacteria bacterium]|nr:DUF5668 domain-containing protein [Ignavibacteria bacterium]